MLSKPQQDNLARTVVGLIASEGEKNVKGISDTFIPHKDQSNLNRFITDAKWDNRELNKRRIELVEDELGLRGSDRCTLVLDDTVVERYGGEGVGYHHDSKHGLVKGHCYVTEICSCNDASYPIDLRLYMPEGTSSKPFRSKVDLACELIDEFEPPSRDVTVQFDEWYLCGDVVKHAEDRGFSWISEARSNRVVFYDGEKLNVSEFLDRMRPFFRDVELDGELYQCLDVRDGAYMPKIRDARLLFNCKADSKDMHNMCSNIKELPTRDLLRRSFERVKIESFHWDIKNVLGFGEYRFRESDAAIIHSHLVLLTYSLLLIMKKRVEERNEESAASISIGEACRIVRDRCLVAICRWFREMYSAGRSLADVLGLIRPHIRIYK